MEALFEQSKQAAVSKLHLPADVLLGEVMVAFTGRYCVMVENYRGILLYDDKTIKLQAKNCRLQINGSRLHIEYYTGDEMKITGVITSMQFDG